MCYGAGEAVSKAGYEGEEVAQGSRMDRLAHRLGIIESPHQFSYVHSEGPERMRFVTTRDRGRLFSLEPLQ